jgi:hypothetical protein
MRKVEVTPYQEPWMTLFEKAAAKLREVLGSEVIEIRISTGKPSSYWKSNGELSYGIGAM